MKRWTVVVAIVALLVAVVAGGIPFAESYIAGEIKTRLERGGLARAGTVEVSLLDRRITLSDVVLKQTVPAGGVAVEATRAEVSGLSWPLSELLAGRTPFTGWRFGDPVQAERVEFANLRVVQADLDWRIGRVTAEGVDLPRYESSSQPPPSLLNEVARALQQLSVRRIEQRDFVVGGMSGGLRLASAVVEGVDKGRVAVIKVADSEMRDVGGEAKPAFTLAETTIRGLDLRRPLSRLSDVAWTPMTPLGRIWMDETVLSGFGGEALGRRGIVIERVTMQSRRLNDRQLEGRTRVEGLAFRPRGFNRETMQTMAIMAALGLREVTASLDCAGGEDRDKGEIAVRDCKLVSPGLAEVELAVRVVNGDDLLWKMLDDGEIGYILGSKAGIGDIRLVLRDQGLRERLIGLYANTNNLPRGEAKTVLAREVRRFQPSGMLITEDMTKLADTIARFVENGGTLTLVAKPDPPLDINRSRTLMTPGPDLIEILGLSATVSP